MNPPRTELNFAAMKALPSICRAGTLDYLFWTGILSHRTHSLMALKWGSISCFSSLNACHFRQAQISSKVPHHQTNKGCRCRREGSCSDCESAGLRGASQHNLLIAFCMQVGRLWNAFKYLGEDSSSSDSPAGFIASQLLWLSWWAVDILTLTLGAFGRW